MKTAALSIDAVVPWVQGRALAFLPARVQASVAQRRHEFIAGRLCAESAMAALGLPVRAIGQLPSGEPAWPTGVTGSITHTRTMAYAVVCPASSGLRLGIDTEDELAGDTLDAVIRTCCTAGERARFLSSDNVVHAASLIFSAKESLYKVIGPAAGRVIDFIEVELTSIDWHTRQIRFAPLSKDLPEFAGRCLGQFRFDCRQIHTSVIGC